MDLPKIHVHVRETSRSRKGTKENHMVKHIRMVHEGNKEPNFALIVVRYYKTALARHVEEAVKGGGSHLKLLGRL